MAGRAVGVRTCEQHEHVGASRERRPRLHAVHDPAVIGARRRDFDAGHVGAVVGLGHHDADHQLAARDARQPRLLLFLGPARDERAR